MEKINPYLNSLYNDMQDSLVVAIDRLKKAVNKLDPSDPASLRLINVSDLTLDVQFFAAKLEALESASLRIKD